MIIMFPLREASTSEAKDEFEQKLAAVLPFADKTEALCQLLADCLVRLDRLESGNGSQTTAS